MLSTVPKNSEKPNSKIFLGHKSHINSVCVFPNKNKLFTAGGSEGIYVWDLKLDLMENPKKINLEGMKPCARRRPDIPLKQEKNEKNASFEEEKDYKRDLEGNDEEEPQKENGNLFNYFFIHFN